jgi:hypothetical protein
MEIDRYGTKSPRVDAERERYKRGNVLVQSRSKLQQPFLVCVVVFLAKRKKNTPSRRGIIIIDDE